jgi:predicted ATP-dependent endonuclease of OLD family
MHIDSVEIQNFRRLAAVRIDFSKTTTLLVGANNSGKTSAIAALRCFLTQQQPFASYDIPLSSWERIDSLGKLWKTAAPDELRRRWRSLLPCLDVWLCVSDEDIHHVSHLIPALDWQSADGIGVRLQLEPRDPSELLRAYDVAKSEAETTLAACAKSEADGGTEDNSVSNTNGFGLWPKSLMGYLQKRLSSVLRVNGYLLDPSKRRLPVNRRAQPQVLLDNTEPLDVDPFGSLIKIAGIPAHRGFGDASSIHAHGNSPHDAGDRPLRLTTQLKAYYAKHLDPLKSPDASDIHALQAIHEAENAFDERLTERFRTPLRELERLGYPGVTNPRLVIATSIKPVEGLNHSSAVQYDVASPPRADNNTQYRLPEQCNGLGYQNLISMVFQLIGFRDDWLKVGKATDTEAADVRKAPSLQPIHLVMLEEPEAHLHVQAQQVFVRKAFDVLRNQENLKNGNLTTQLLVSTHSSHIAHEAEFANMRYFRRHPARKPGETPTSTVVNLSEIFGAPDDTARFVSRYLRASHADLLFADGAIMVEGAAERILLPHFIESRFKDLSSCHITVLEINGSHAHRFEPLIRHLGINTLIITDIDAVDKDSRKSVPSGTPDAVTANSVLKTWHPRASSVSELVALKEDEKAKRYDEQFSVRVAFQTPVAVRLGGSDSQSDIIPRTFEDALMLQNVSRFTSTNLAGLFRKFRTAVEECATVERLGERLLKDVGSATKAQFALDVLYYLDPESLEEPAYIRNGLAWLQDRLSFRREEVVTEGTDDVCIDAGRGE